jgi:subtilisin family serine protease
MGHKSAQVIVKVILFSCLAIGVSWLIAEKEVYAENTTPVIVKLVDGADVSGVAGDYDAVVIKTLPSLGLYLLESSLSDLAVQLTADTRVIAVYEETTIEGQPRYGGAFGNELDAKPWGTDSDPAAAYKEQWPLSNVRLPKAHEISQGEGIIVAVLDTGIDLSHELFQGKLVAGYDFVDDDAIPAESRDGVDQDGDQGVDEGAGHGTHVAGVVALTAPQAQIMPIRIFDDEGRGLYFDLVAGIMYAVDHGADVINLSGSGPEDAAFLAEAVAYAEAHHVVFVAAGAVNSFGYPASYESVISVGASDEMNYPTDFSDFSDMLDSTVYAPGLAIISGYDDGGYAVWTGNSMATPFVAGTAALLLAVDSCDNNCAYSSLLETAHPVVIDPGTNEFYKRIDAFDAVSAAINHLHTDMAVMVMDGNTASTDGLSLRPYFNIVNHGNSVPLHELTLRYWFTKDGDADQLVVCDYALIACDNIFNEVVETAVSDSYLEIHFSTEAGILLGTHETGNIQLRIHKTDWSNYNELNDYSYNGAANFTENQQVTLYHNGRLIWGEEPANSQPTPASTTVPTAMPTSTAIPTNTPAATSTPIPTVTSSVLSTSTPQPTEIPIDVSQTTSDIRVQYQAANTDPYDRRIQPYLQLVNDSSNTISLSDLRIRYWFTDAETAVIQPNCDYAAVQCSNITAVTDKSGTQHYLDITFAAAAGELAPGADSGHIHLRLHHTDWTPLDESDDYSFTSSATTFTDSQNITLYQNGSLIWGIEP